ncbi:hypothetical protein H2200_009662 [Cladophialophora chaetospira]|uniref:Uncharacterized protein n=1 Tax=Cladophialophora chaetospira TaxID=386627 RepID=A0AA39CEY2_9EURO|nr:hypothetical protein H2200_009662 [Cladophialophora chaetospira]
MAPTSDSKLVRSKAKGRASEAGSGSKPAGVVKARAQKPAKKLKRRLGDGLFSRYSNDVGNSHTRANSEALTAPPTTVPEESDDGELSDLDTEIYELRTGRMLSINHLEAAMRLISQGKHVPSIAAGYGISAKQLVHEVTQYALEKDEDKYGSLVDAVIGTIRNGAPVRKDDHATTSWDKSQGVL